MGSYKILIKRSAEKELRKIPKPYLEKMVRKIHTLAENPRPEGSELLKGGERHYRIRQGDYRIVYEISDATAEITIIKIGHRREVYE